MSVKISGFVGQLGAAELKTQNEREQEMCYRRWLSPNWHMKLPPHPLLCVGRVAPASSLTLRLKLVQDGLCPANDATYCDSSHSLSHAADTTEAGMRLLGLVVGR